MSPIVFLIDPIVFLLNPIVFLINPIVFLIIPIVFLISPIVFIINLMGDHSAGPVLSGNGDLSPGGGYITKGSALFPGQGESAFSQGVSMHR